MGMRGYLGIDAGTQGLSVLFANEALDVVAIGEAGYEMVPGLPEGQYEQRPGDWKRALQEAMANLHQSINSEYAAAPEVLAIGISGQMHGEVLCDDTGKPLASARLWCDARNETEGATLTETLAQKIPKRMTAARWLWTVKHRPEVAKVTKRMTTPAGWMSQQLTGKWCLGIGDASGMFPIDQTTLDYDRGRLDRFAAMIHASGVDVPPLAELLPAVRRAGEDGGTLDHRGAELLGLEEGILVAPAEGDQPAALAGSLIGEAGMISMSFGTSVCANSVGDRPFSGVSEAVDHFCAVDGKPINMVWLRNGTTYMNSIIEMLGLASGADRATSFAQVMPQLLSAPNDCGGLLALPFMDDEPGLGVAHGGSAMIIGLNSENAQPGNVAKASLLSTIFNLRLGSEVLNEQGFPRTEIVLTGGLTKTPALGQIVSDVFDTPVTLLATAEEGTAWGAALLGKFRHLSVTDGVNDWVQFLAAHASKVLERFEPNAEAAAEYALVYQRYQKLFAQHLSLV